MIALHGMAYYIFINTRGAQKNFGKVLMPKFLLNLFLQISKALVNSKPQFLFGKEFSFAFGPIGPAASQPGLSAQLATGLLSRRPRARSAHPSLRGSGVLAKIRFLFHIAQPGDDAFSLCHCQVGPTCQLYLPPHAGRSRPHRRFSQPTRLYLEMRAKQLTSLP
jgi:hypothetical protein